MTIERLTIWKSDLKDNMVSQELAKLFLEGKVKLVAKGRNFVEIEYPANLYFEIYSKYGVAEKPLKSFKELWIWEKEETKNEFDAYVVLDKLTLMELKSKLPYRWWKVLSGNDNFRNWLKNREEYRYEYKGDYFYLIETSGIKFFEKYKDKNGEYIVFFELEDDFIISPITEGREIAYIYIRNG